MIPNPVMRKPGSMPRILRAGPAIAPHYTFECAARAPLRRLLIDHRGRVDVLRVVEALQGVEQLLHLRRLVALQDVLGNYVLQVRVQAASGYGPLLGRSRLQDEVRGEGLLSALNLWRQTGD